jgi:hypothetical protein
MDNRKLVINGEEDSLLQKALELAFLQEGVDQATEALCRSWKFSKEEGLVLSWAKGGNGFSDFPVPMNSAEVFPIIKRWLSSEEAAQVTPNEGSEDFDHDGHNERGWEVYCGDWGHVGQCHTAICAVKPAYCWMGK